MHDYHCIVGYYIDFYQFIGITNFDISYQTIHRIERTWYVRYPWLKLTVYSNLVSVRRRQTCTVLSNRFISYPNFRIHWNGEIPCVVANDIHRNKEIPYRIEILNRTQPSLSITQGSSHCPSSTSYHFATYRYGFVYACPGVSIGYRYQSFRYIGISNFHIYRVSKYSIELRNHHCCSPLRARRTVRRRQRCSCPRTEPWCCLRPHPRSERLQREIRREKNTRSTRQ